MAQHVRPECQEQALMIRTGIFGFVLLANAVALFCIFNPWIEKWSSQAVVFLVLEAVFLVVIGIPVFLYHFVHKKKPLKQSLADSIQTMIDFLAGWV